VPPRNTTNLIANPGFETSLDGYTGVGVDLTRDDSWRAAGTWSAKATTTDTTDSYIDGTTAATGALRPDHPYRLEASCHLDAAHIGDLAPDARTLQITVGETTIISDPAPNEPGSHQLWCDFTATGTDVTELRLNVGAATHVATNVNPNPSLELDAAGYDGGARDDAWAGRGDWSLRVPATGAVQVHADAAAAAANVTPGVAHTVTATVRLVEPQAGDTPPEARSIVALWDGGQAVSDQAPNEAGQHTVSLTFTPPTPLTGLHLCGAPPLVRTNLAPRPSLAGHAFPAIAGCTVVATDETTGGFEGRPWRRMAVTVGSNTATSWGCYVQLTGPTGSISTANRIPVVAGREYTFSTAWRHIGPQTAARLEVALWNSTGTRVNFTVNPAWGQNIIWRGDTTTDGSWNPVTATFTVPEGLDIQTMSAQLMSAAQSTAGSIQPGHEWGFAGLVIREGGASGDNTFFDGDTPDTGEWEHAWTGPEGASPSTATRQQPVWFDDITVVQGATPAQFDGDTPDTAATVYDWTGPPHASTSTATTTQAMWWDEIWLSEVDDTAVTATLLAGGPPQAVQVVLTGLDPGTGYSVVGSTPDGRMWEIPGGVGVTTGTQAVLIDPLAPINTPVHYVLTVAGQTYTSNEVTVAFDGCCVLTSLDGAVVVPVRWIDNRLPEEPDVHTVTYPVPGRVRPPGRYTTTGDGGGVLEFLVLSAYRDDWRALLRPGAVVVLRTDGTVADWPGTELIAVTAVSTELAPTVLDRWARKAEVEYMLVDLPDPEAAIAIYDWNDFDTIYADATWDDFDAEWAAATWDDFDRQDWGQRL
jgi:hypothetical protein